jgi:hypothetical protein
MSNMIAFYKPNARNTGIACSFRVEDKAVKVNFIKQFSWDGKKGSFIENQKNPANNTFIKLNQVEVGGLIHCLETNQPFSQYHSTPKTKTQIKFEPYFKKNDKGELFQAGYSFLVTKEYVDNPENKASFLMGFYFNEAVVLREFLKDGLRQTFAFVPENKQERASQPEQTSDDASQEAAETTSESKPMAW